MDWWFINEDQRQAQSQEAKHLKWEVACLPPLLTFTLYSSNLTKSVHEIKIRLLTKATNMVQYLKWMPNGCLKHSSKDPLEICWLRASSQQLLLQQAPFRCNPSSLWWANRKSGATPGVLSPPTKTNLGWRFLGNQKLHTKMGIKMKDISGLIDTWYLLGFGSNVMKCAVLKSPQTRSAWRLWGLRGWMPKQWEASQGWPSHYRAVTLTKIRPINEQVRPQKNSSWQVAEEKLPDLNRTCRTWCWVLGKFPVFGVWIFSSTSSPRFTKNTLHQETGSKSYYSKAYGQIIGNPKKAKRLSCHIPGPRFLPSLAPYLRSNASSCDGYAATVGILP